MKKVNKVIYITEVDKFIDQHLTERKLKKRRRLIAAAIMSLGLLIANSTNSSLSFKSLFASESDYKQSAETMTTFIVAEYQKQGRTADLDSICKSAKRLDQYGLSVNVSNDGSEQNVYITKDSEPSPRLIKKFKLNK